MNFVILAPKRSGSTFLQEALSSHPNIKCYDEMFMIRGSKSGKRRNQYLYRYMKKTENHSIPQYIKWLYNQHPEKSIGFRLMYPHEEKWNVLKTVKKKNIPVIHLVRENLLGKTLSSYTKNLFEVKKMHIDTNRLMANIRLQEKRQNEYREKMKGHKNLLTLRYEDIIGRTEGDKGEIKKFGAFNLKSNMYTYIPTKVCENICNFLNEDFFEMYSNVTKKNSHNPWDYIKNKDEVKDALKKEGYERFIIE